jgi:predicted GNAT family N-acyltransferase
MTIELFDAGDAVRLQAALEVRFEVFVDEQGVPPAEEVDAHDRAGSSAVHALASAAAGVAGTGRFFALDDRTVQVGRMAVRAHFRGAGVGAAILRALLAEAKRRGYRRVVLDAQVEAVEFYRRFDFRPIGEVFVDAGILHQKMEREL